MSGHSMVFYVVLFSVLLVAAFVATYHAGKEAGRKAERDSEIAQARRRLLAAEDAAFSGLADRARAARMREAGKPDVG